MKQVIDCKYFKRGLMSFGGNIKHIQVKNLKYCCIDIYVRVIVVNTGVDLVWLVILMKLVRLVVLFCTCDGVGHNVGVAVGPGVCVGVGFDNSVGGSAGIGVVDIGTSVQDWYWCRWWYVLMLELVSVSTSV